MLKRTLFILAISCCWVPAQAQQFIYKWTDEQGQPKYSELPPPKGVAYEMVRKPATAQGTEPTARDPAKELAEKKAQEEAKLKEQAEQAQQAQKDAEDQRAKNCEIAKKNVQVLQGDSPVVKTDPKGNKVALDPPQRESELKKAQKDMDYFCNP